MTTYRTPALALCSVVLSLAALSYPSSDVRASESAVAIAWNDSRAGTGMLGAIDTAAPWNQVREPIPVGLDSILHSAFGKLFVLSAVERTVRVIDPLSWTVERSFQFDSRDEPVDINVASPTLAYVSRRNTGSLLQVDLLTGQTSNGPDLGIFADGDGNPDQGTMALDGGRLFVQLQRINFDEPTETPRPYLAVVDVATQQIIDVDPARDGIQAIELAGTFPKLKMQVLKQSRKLFVSATGAFFNAGGIESIDLDSLRSDGLVIREADDFTGADLGAFVMTGPERGFLVYSTDLLLSSHLHQFSLTGGVDPKELAADLNYFSPVLGFDPETNHVFMPLGGGADNGLSVFDADSGMRLNDALISTSGPPTDVVILTAIPEPATLTLSGCGLTAVVFLALSAWHRSREQAGGRL